MSNLKKGALLLMGATLIYSIMPVLIRTLDADQMPPASQVFLRYIVAFLSASVYFFLIKKEKFNLKSANWKLLVLAGVVGYGLTNLLFTYGVILTDVANALFLFYTFGIITPIFGYLVLKEKVNKFNILSLALGLLSLAFLFQPASVATWKTGGLLALASAFTQTFYLISRKKLSGYSSAMMLVSSTFLGTISVGLIAIISESDFYFGTAGITQISLSTWLITILFGIGNFVAWFLMSKGFEYVKSTTGSLILLGENVLALLFVFIFFAEVPSISALIGGALIIGATIVVIYKGDNS